EKLNNVFGAYVASLGLRQLRIAETEKYAHVTFFFNGGSEASLPGEEHTLIASPKVATYDLEPAMSADAITAKLVANIASNAFDVIICNYANADMLGHTGKLAAAVTAVECIDSCLTEIINITGKMHVDVLITADHGNVECMFNPHNNQAHTAHTTALVPLVYVGNKAHFLVKQGSLCDVAPTILRLLNLPIPSEMTGKNILQLQD
ncbi:MAG: phosphoglycerate mutase (2,3-diphosphoglycerate-independent), partial [Legionellales bacterium]